VHSDGSEQVSGKCGDATLAGQMIADEGYFLNLRGFIHKRLDCLFTAPVREEQNTERTGSHQEVTLRPGQR
jgi:hypothetical protein